MQEGQDCPESSESATGGFPTAVTRKSPTVWRRFMDHRKAERVGYRNGIQSFRSFGQSEAQRLNPDQLRFCPEAKISSDISHQNSETPKLLNKRSRMSNGKKARRVAQLYGVQLWDRIL
jgi:hypothetical protein